MENNQPRRNDQEFQAIAQQLDKLIQQFEQLPIPEVQDKVFEMLQVIDALHREGLLRLVDLLQEAGQGSLLEKAAQDQALAALLVMYDILPGDELLQVERALDAVRPYLHSHGGEVEVLSVEQGVVHLTLTGSCQGCAGSTVTLQRGVEAVLLERVPGFKGIEVHEPQQISGQKQASGLISFDEIDPVPVRTLNAPVFKSAARLADLPPGSLRPAALENVNLLMANIAGEVFAIGAECPGSDFPLTYGKLDGHRLTCPWHKEVFDVRSGKCLEPAGQDARLAVYPVALSGDEVLIAVNVAAQSMHPD